MPGIGGTSWNYLDPTKKKKAEPDYPSYVEETINAPGEMGSTYSDWLNNPAGPNYGGGGGSSSASATTDVGPYSEDAWDYWKKASATPGMTPQQIAAMRSQAITAQQSASAGMADKIREMLAAQGLGGGGYEQRALTQNMMGSEANLQNALTQQALAAAEAERLGRQNYAQMGLQGAGTLGNLNLNAQAQDLQGQALADQMYRWSHEFDYDRLMNAQNKADYEGQLADYNKQISSLFGNNDPGRRGLSIPSILNRNSVPTRRW